MTALLDHGTWYILLASVFGFMMTWGVGANDLANIMSTSLGSKAITIKQAMIIAVIFETAGAFFGGSGVTQTIRDGIINIHALDTNPLILVEGMLAVLAAGMSWMALASYFGMPVSITNAIVGAIVGFGLVVLGAHAIHWHQVSYIAISWVTAPVIAGVFAYILLRSIQDSILAKRDPIANARKLLPIYFFMIGIVLTFMIALKGLKHFGYLFTAWQQIYITLAGGVLVTVVGYMAVRPMLQDQELKRSARFAQVEKVFAVLMALTSCAMVFAHGSNDVAIAVGPLTVVVSILQHGGHLALEGGYPSWVILLGCVGVITGLFMYGRKVIATVGSGITTLTPSRAFAATLAAATAVVVSTSTGIPVSATQTLVGAILGVGLARGIGALNLRVVRNIFMSWFVTLPAASGLTILFFHVFKLAI